MLAKRLPYILALLLIPTSVFAGSASYSTPGSYSFTVPAYGTLSVQAWGGGGAGGGYFQYAGGGAGGSSSFGGISAGGGAGGAGVTRADDPNPRPGGAGGSASGGSTNSTGGAGLSGSPGETYVSSCSGPSGAGGASPAGGAGGAAVSMTATGNSGVAPGGGGSGGAGATMYSWPEGGGNYFECATAGGGGGGGYAAKTYSLGQLTPGSTIAVTVGSGGAPWLYNGQLYNGAGGYGAPGRVTITWTAPPPASCSVSLTPNPINRGGSSILSWSSSNADSWVYINNVSYVGASGSVSVAPSSTTDFSCYAQGSGGSDGWHSAVLTVYQPCSWNSGSISHSTSVTAYQSSNVPYNQSCVSQTRTCSNGTLSGSYTNPSCSVTPATSCTLDGVIVPHGTARTFYTNQVAPTGQLCSSIGQSRTCTNGVLSGSASYQYASCTCAPIYSCSGNNVMYTNASCSTSTAAVCTAPNYCSPGVSTCVTPPPTFNPGSGTSGHLQVRPQVVRSGSTASVSWNVSNVSSCTTVGSNGDSWSGSSGAKTTSAISQRTTYTLACTGLDGSRVNESAVVNVTPVFQEQ